MRTAIVALILLLIGQAADARSSAIVRAFRELNPCPLTGLTTGPCRSGNKKMVVDHKLPICAGGPDTLENLMWQEYEESLRKDKIEKAICRKLASCAARP